MTKGRNLPQTPISAMPQTPVPQTPNVSAAAQGWMEDIKRVISFDSVEEFWGYVSSPAADYADPIDIRLYNNIVPPSQLPQKANYYLFKVCSFVPSCCVASLTLPLRRASFQLGKMRPIKMGVNGAYNCLRTKTVLTLIACGCIRYGYHG